MAQEHSGTKCTFTAASSVTLSVNKVGDARAMLCYDCAVGVQGLDELDVGAGPGLIAVLVLDLNCAGCLLWLIMCLP